MHIGFYDLVTEDRPMPKAGAIATIVAGATTSVVGVATVRGDVSSAAAVVGLALVGATIAGVVTGRHARAGAVGLGAWTGLLAAWPATVLTVPAVITHVVGVLPQPPPGGHEGVALASVLNAMLARGATAASTCTLVTFLAGSILGALGAWVGSRAPGDADTEGVPSVPGVDLVFVASLVSAHTGAALGRLVETMDRTGARPTQIAPFLLFDAWPWFVGALAMGWAMPRLSHGEPRIRDRRVLVALLAVGPVVAIAVRVYRMSAWTLTSAVAGATLGVLGAWPLRPTPGFTPDAITMDFDPRRAAVRNYLGITQLLAVASPIIAVGLMAGLGVVPAIEAHTKGTPLPPADLHDLLGPRSVLAFLLAAPALAAGITSLMAAPFAWLEQRDRRAD